MGLDITVMERKDVRCPHCGEVVNTVEVDGTNSGGSLWYDFLERLGYRGESCDGSTRSREQGGHQRRLVVR